ncbi:hypothetical protein SteCoe_13434 [Stentor coeruleus]|uniref:PPM-type phosphatase domain-containing protein n=1 Tax=Stentor coeruleus TaxID=5963 RepID=A0A1R2C8C6_9CILI|nr:hypothetical protein SteCoe_13434 [Stentor coeruleus]
MEPTSQVIRSKSSSLSKPKESFYKALQNLAKHSTTPTSRRELLQNIYFPLTSRSKKPGKTFFEQLSSSGLSKSQRSPKKKTRSKTLSIAVQNQAYSSHKEFFSASKKSSKLLKGSLKRGFLGKKKLFQGKKPKPSTENHNKKIPAVSFRTKTGSIKGKTKPNNQDDFFVIQDYSHCKNQTLIGVMDGHGMYGHEISAYIKKQLPLFIETYMPEDKQNKDYSEDYTEKITKAFIKGYKSTQKALVNCKAIDINYSGTTANTLLIKNKLCFCANLGDTRAIIGRFNYVWHYVELSHDHKPSNHIEKIRIEKSGGRVEPYKETNGNFIGPARVWMKKQQLPGLAMSRAFGDLVASTIGVISVPEIKVHHITDDDKFIVIASDGIWEFISSQECVKIVSEAFLAGDIEKACDNLMKKAMELWNKNDEIIDDITFVIVFLN